MRYSKDSLRGKSDEQRVQRSGQPINAWRLVMNLINFLDEFLAKMLHAINDYGLSCALRLVRPCARSGQCCGLCHIKGDGELIGPTYLPSLPAQAITT